MNASIKSIPAHREDLSQHSMTVGTVIDGRNITIEPHAEQKLVRILAVDVPSGKVTNSVSLKVKGNERAFDEVVDLLATPDSTINLRDYVKELETSPLALGSADLFDPPFAAGAFVHKGTIKRALGLTLNLDALSAEFEQPSVPNQLAKSLHGLGKKYNLALTQVSPTQIDGSISRRSLWDSNIVEKIGAAVTRISSLLAFHRGYIPKTTELLKSLKSLIGDTNFNMPFQTLVASRITKIKNNNFLSRRMGEIATIGSLAAITLVETGVVRLGPITGVPDLKDLIAPLILAPFAYLGYSRSATRKVSQARILGTILNAEANASTKEPLREKISSKE